MKAGTKSNRKTKPQKPSLTTLGQLGQLGEGKLPERPLSITDPPGALPLIEQHQIVELDTAFHIFQLARADSQAKRAALVMKLLRGCRCEDGDYFTFLDDRNILVIEDRTSVEVGTGRPIVDCIRIPSGGAV